MAVGAEQTAGAPVAPSAQPPAMIPSAAVTTSYYPYVPQPPVPVPVYCRYAISLMNRDMQQFRCYRTQRFNFSLHILHNGLLRRHHFQCIIRQRISKK